MQAYLPWIYMKIYGDRIAACGDLELDFVYYPLC